MWLLLVRPSWPHMPFFPLASYSWPNALQQNLLMQWDRWDSQDSQNLTVPDCHPRVSRCGCLKLFSCFICRTCAGIDSSGSQHLCGASSACLGRSAVNTINNNQRGALSSHQCAAFAALMYLLLTSALYIPSVPAHAAGLIHTSFILSLVMRAFKNMKQGMIPTKDVEPAVAVWTYSVHFHVCIYTHFYTEDMSRSSGLCLGKGRLAHEILQESALANMCWLVCHIPDFMLYKCLFNRSLMLAASYEHWVHTNREAISRLL